MKKITELTETRFRTTYKKDNLGNRIKGREDYTTYRKVQYLPGGIRFLHLIVDSTIVGFVYSVIQILLAHQSFVNPSPGIEITLLTMQIFYFFIPYLLMEHFFQTTIGKLMTQSIVVDEYGNKPDFKTILLRSVVRVIPFDAFTFLGDEARGWHDKLSSTYVISKKELIIIKKLQKEQS